MWQKYVSLLIFAAAASCFNIDTNFPKVFVDPASTKNKNMKSYFGYSVVMNPMSNTNPVEWIRIGAPKAKNSRGTIDGLVYNCDMNGCEPIELPKSIFGNERIKEKLEHGWIGGTMDISYEFDRMTVCAFHRYYVNGGDFTTMGTCYLSTLNSTTFENMDPLLDPYVPVADKRYYLYGQGQAGFSAHFSDHRGDFIDLVLGAPGVYNWAGTPIKVKYEVINSPPANRRRKKRATNYHKTVAIPDTSETLVDNILFGYAVTSGYFYQDETLYYAASTPKGNDYKGKVVIFEFDSSRAIQGKETKLGEQFGEYFGASIASGKINSDNLDDLVVGAPYFKDKSYNEGRVYVFLSERMDLKMYTVLTGRSTNSQFGSAIMCLGDIDLDGYGDIAIGAPYEDDNTGAIYIYGGSNTGVDKIPRQIILGKQITPEILGFGIIISKAIDMDHNNYKDLAIGAYLSGNAVLLRSRPIVVVHYNLLAAPSVLKLDSTSFLLNICFSYSIHSEETVDIIYEIKVVGRANIFGNETIIRNLVITKGNLTCDSINVTVEESENLSSSIKAVFSYRLNYNSTEKGITYISESVLENKDELCIRCPVLDEYRSNETYKEFDIPFTRDCGDDDICQSNLSISINIAGLGKNEPFVLGSRNNLEVEVVLDNTGENAFGTELQIILPEVTFRQKPARCRNIFTNGSAVICTIDNPLRKNATRILHLDLNLETNLYKFSSAKELQMLFTIVTTSENSKNFVRYGLELRREADIKLFGISEQQSNFLGNSTTGTSDVTHTYKIEKIGVSPLENITVEIEIPHTYVSLQKEVTFIGVYEPISFVGSQPMTCRSELTYASLKRSQTEEENVFGDVRRKRQVEVFKNVSTHNKEDVKINDKEIELTPNKTLYLNSSSEAVKWSSIICEFDMLQESLASIEIRMLFNISAISDLMESKDTILFSTHGKVKIGKTAKSGNRSIDVSTAFVNDVIKKKKVALWIIILSAIAGLLLLALLVYGLIKARFFKRTIREELENMKAALTNQAVHMGDSFILPPEIYQNLETLVQDLNFEDYTINLSKGSTKGDNYLGIITKAKITAHKNGRSSTLNLIVKNASQVEEYRQYIKIHLLYQREVYMYQHVLPKLFEFQEELNLQPYYPFVKLMKSSLDPPYEFLIMEDKKAHGYIMNDRKAPIDFNHCSLVMKSLGRYHALSFALQHMKPDIFRELAQETREIYFNSVSLETLSNTTIKCCCDRIIKNLKEDADKELIHKIQEFVKFPIEGLLNNLSAEAAEEHAVFCHGDCWTNNFLFKYEDEDPSNPTQICILDWQMSRCASPAVDVAYFMFVSTERELRQHHYHDLLGIYHSSLTDFLEELGCEPGLFPRDVFLHHMRKFSKYGLMMACIVVPLIVAENEELPDWTDEMSQDERQRMFTDERKNEMSTMSRLVDVVRDFDKYGYFN